MTTDPHGGAELTDDALQHEIELVGDLVVAASASERQLTEEEIDRALGIRRGHPITTGEPAGHPLKAWTRQNA
ncbi:hypothetical protein [Pedococcus sp. 5OH_020]|uniref:hypothetical protein n=1 Tax=Pedococcus sp. 5OH_020 TaxID=2989814 RepID=UPI0022EA0763|nr:hypothetical protein [Pedococcus sp. 5OH_020]